MEGELGELGGQLADEAGELNTELFSLQLAISVRLNMVTRQSGEKLTWRIFMMMSEGLVER